MVPTEEQAKQLWEKYRLPGKKRIHVSLVARLAMFFASKIQVDKKLLLAAALLHDIDQAMGGTHPETAVALLKQEGLHDVAEIVRTHAVHCILDESSAPKTMEQKLLYLADKMVKYDIVGVDERFALWKKENVTDKEIHILEESYPKVKELEQEVFKLAQITPDDILQLKEVHV